METYIVRQPIQDRAQNVIGYEMLYQQRVTDMYGESDSMAANAIGDFLVQLDSENLLDGKEAYITFTPNLLLKDIPKMFSPTKLVIQVEDNSIVHPLAQKVIYQYKKMGYRIALIGFEFSPRYFGMLDVVDIIKINFASADTASIGNLIGICKSFNKIIIAYNVNTKEAYDRAVELDIRLLQGSAVSQQFRSKVRRMDHIQSNFFQLMVAITKDEPDIDEIAEVISRDVTLTYSLLKLVNSAYFALRNRAKSVKQALVILGLGQLKQWIYLLSFKQDGADVPDELIRMSFLRANFCSELSQYAPKLPISKSEAYLLGMFSTLGILMETPLETALAQLSVSEDIFNGLITGEGLCGSLYNLVLAYEKADWRTMTGCAQELEIPMSIITQKYFECVEYVNQIWNSLNASYDPES